MTNGNDFVQFVSGDAVATDNLGMTKREMFAAMAMQGMLANSYFAENAPRERVDAETETLDFHLTRRACAVADTLIAALNKTTP